jgi:hypothetical protein
MIGPGRIARRVDVKISEYLFIRGGIICGFYGSGEMGMMVKFSPFGDIWRQSVDY